MNEKLLKQLLINVLQYKCSGFHLIHKSELPDLDKYDIKIMETHNDNVIELEVVMKKWTP